MAARAREGTSVSGTEESRLVTEAGEGTLAAGIREGTGIRAGTPAPGAGEGLLGAGWLPTAGTVALTDSAGSTGFTGSTTGSTASAGLGGAVGVAGVVG